MKNLLSLFLASHMGLAAFPTRALACSIFMQPETGMVAKNFDWSLAEGELMIRPVNVRKHALGSNKTWVSRYGSVTFNQYGPDLPTGGLNSEGLLMEALILGQTQHQELGPTEEKEALNEAEFIQYNLDNYKSVEEVVAHISELKIKKQYVPIHYFTCDNSKQCAVIEYLQGKVKVFTDKTLEEPILTNMAYAKVLSKYQQNLAPTSEAFASYARFKLLADYKMKNFTKASMLEKLNQVKVSGTTVWQIVYSPEEKSVDLLHIFSKRPVNVQMNDIDFRCQKPIRLLNFKDGDEKFTVKNIKTQLLKRISNLTRVNSSIKLLLANRPLENNCL